jgi:hypothetical protein
LFSSQQDHVALRCFGFPCRIQASYDAHTADATTLPFPGPIIAVVF